MISEGELCDASSEEPELDREDRELQLPEKFEHLIVNGVGDEVACGRVGFTF